MLILCDINVNNTLKLLNEETVHYNSATKQN